MQKFLFDDPAGGGFLPGLRQFAEIGNIQRHSQARSDYLHEALRGAGEGRAKDFMPSHDLIERALQNGGVDGRRQAQHIKNIEERQVRERAMQAP